MDDDDDLEVISAEAEVVAVVSGPGELTRSVRTEEGALLALRTAAVAATGFLAGAATVASLRRAGVGRRACEPGTNAGQSRRNRNRSSTIRHARVSGYAACNPARRLRLTSASPIAPGTA